MQSKQNKLVALLWDDAPTISVLIIEKVPTKQHGWDSAAILFDSNVSYDIFYLQNLDDKDFSMKNERKSE